jgi:6-phosphogluconolactonase
MKYKAYIGTYSVRNSKGIYLTEADTETGTLTILDSWQAENPSYLAVSDRYLFAVLECNEFEGTYGGGAASYAIGHDGSLSLLSVRPTGGTSPCHVCPAPDGKKLYVPNYGDGVLSVFDVKGGKLSEASLIKYNGSGLNEAQQKGSHLHYAVIEPGSGRLCVTALGIDRVVFFNTADMSAAGEFTVKSGSGPRHIVFSEHTPYAWMVCELSSEIYAFEPRSGKQIGVYSTLSDDFTGKSTCAAIKLSPDEKRLYASNREHDSIACYDIDTETGKLTLLAICSTGGKTPRDFVFSPDGKFLYAANQDTDNINIFKMENGVPVETGLSLDIPSPVCVLFYNGHK